MQKLNNIILAIIIVSLSNFCEAKEIDKNGLFNKLKEDYKTIETIHLQFSMSMDSELLGELYAQRGGKIRLSLKDNIIVSDGKTIWNINPGYSVSISDYEPTNEFSLENIFFDLIKELEPYNLKYINKSNSSEKYNLSLKPIKNSSYKEKIKSINLYFDSKQNITKVSVNGLDNSSTTYYIRSLEIDPIIASDKFTFRPDSKIEVIDFR